MQSFRRTFLFIILLAILSLFISLPSKLPIKFNLLNRQIDKTFTRPQINLKLGSWSFNRDLNLKKGLDLQGGTHLVLEADMKDIAQENHQHALDSAKEIISRRVDLYGVSEPNIQTSQLKDSYRIIVELPGIKEVEKAVDLIGQTAQLDFRQDPELDVDVDYSSPSAIMRIFEFVPTGLTGKDLKLATVTFSQQGPTAGQPVVSLQFNDEGAAKFADITQRNLNLPVAIFIDDQLLTAPRVNDPILDGQAIISGGFTSETASNLAIQLNAGALPVPIKIIEQKNISATLGSDSVAKSIKAGTVGLFLVMLFMFLYYGKNGLLANLALVIYGLLTLSVYKLIPVTLTLPGIAGFVLSVGMAVDSNILIFERLKEELRAGRPFHIAMELGFGRAWDSIKDANVCTIITSLVLLNPLNWNFLNTSGMVRGFALTLLIGVIISLFTGIVVTRTLMRVFLLRKLNTKY